HGHTQERDVHFYSFDFGDPVFEMGGLKLSVQVITTINTYGLAAEACELRAEDGRWRLVADRLMWAGNQERAPGRVELVVTRRGGRLSLTGNAQAGEPIRCYKIIIRNLPPCTVYDSLGDQCFWGMGGERQVTAEGLVSTYPGVTAPVWALQRDGRPWLSFRSQDREVRPKRFAAYRDRDGVAIELIFEEDARRWDDDLELPEWIVEPASIEAALRSHAAFLEAECGLRRWAARQDMPAWARDISLVISIHGMHWCGYVFNTYARALEIVHWVCQRIDGRRVLVFLPGWEGRYYWQYGDYRPEPRLGGPEGFARLCQGVRARGAHLMPMFGANCVNAWFENYASFGPQSPILSGTRLVFQGNRPDWDTSRSGDTGWQAWLNPGAPAWQDELVRQVSGLVSRYGFDAAFFDTTEAWDNDPDHAVFEGLQQLASRLRRAHPQLLLCAESWWDRLLAVFVAFHAAPLGPGAWMADYARRWAHLCEAEPSRGSTGVHELGHTPYVEQELAPGYWPTISFVEDTLEKAQPKIEDVIALAREHAARFLAPLPNG
ncbi:MAG: hypothetical protein QME94_03160, partial [Anaerolineae bacterium]|nr:hypothetical protein [Anaerolineae bacterium]